MAPPTTPTPDEREDASSRVPFVSRAVRSKLYDRLDRQDRERGELLTMVKEIKTAVIGNPEMRQKGLMDRVDVVEIKQEQSEKQQATQAQEINTLKTKMAIVASVASAIVAAIIGLLIKVFTVSPPK